MNGYIYNSSADSAVSDSVDTCESFLESYAHGNIDVGGPNPPESATLELTPEILLNGQFMPPSAPDEAQRVRELYQYRALKELNHGTKLGFDKFARLATLVCDTEICIVNFLDDKIQYTSAEDSAKLWLKHKAVGKPLTLCAHTILRRSAEIFEIPDTTKDWRFNGKSFVTGEPHIRFYAGAPLRARAGYNIGSLCVLDYVPKRLTEQQTSALKDIANMIMNDLELHREKELVDLKGRMANSITEFIRGLVNREKKTDIDKQLDVLGLPRGRRSGRTHNTQGWMKRSRSADKRGKKAKDETEGAMGFVTLAKAQKAVDSAELYPPDDTEEDSTDTESVLSQGIDELDLKEMYRFACRLMRETLDIEGVYLIDIDGIDWKHALSGPDDRDDRNTNTHKYGQEFEAGSSILGYSRIGPFSANQRDTFPSIGRWDEEAEISNLNTPEEKDEGGFIARHSPLSEESTPSVPEFSSQTSHVDDSSYVSARTGSHYVNGGFSNQFLAKFLSENPFGKIFNEGLPDELQNFLPSGVISAMLVPIYDFDQHPFAMTCAYSSRKHKWFSDAEMKYLEGFGSQILSQVLKKRIMMADRAKGIFISNISHELRSPLHGILASAEFISDTKLDTLQRTFVDTIDSCGRTLLEVINHVLDFGKLTYIAHLKNQVSGPNIQRSTSKETVARNINATPVDLMAVTEQVVESCYAGYEFKGLFGQVDIGTMLGEAGQKVIDRRKAHGYGRAKDPASALTVAIDVEYRAQGWFFLLQSGAIQRILMNITGNALKYTPSGWVRIQLSAEETDGKTNIHITVSDSGKGISADFLKNRMFSPFAQEDTLQAGTGLGMSIVKQVTEGLGGEIIVKSQLNVGTQVHVSLPAEPMDRLQGVDICTRVQSLTTDMKVFLAGFDKTVPASRLLYESMAHYLTDWYNMCVVDDVYSSDLIISDECPELLDYFQQRSPTERSAFAVRSPHGTLVSTPEINQRVYRAWQPLIVLCSNALRYEFFGQQAESGKIIDFSSKPCGPYKLARSLLFCLEQAETRRRSLEGTDLSIPQPLATSPTMVSKDSIYPISDQGLESAGRGSFGRGVVRLSPTVRQGSSSHGASMYVPGRGFVAAPTSSIVQPQQFVGVRRKSTIGQKTPSRTDEEERKFDQSEEREQNEFKISNIVRTAPSNAEKPKQIPPPIQTPGLYNRRNPPRSIAISSMSRPTEFSQPPVRQPYVLIVEDNSVNALILATFLKKRGYPFAKAENGLLAVHAVQARPEGFDIILMDIQMPVMDGSAATAAIRSIEQDRSANRPAYIVALTGLAAEKDRQLAFESGVDHFLTKPVSLKQLDIVVEDWEKRDAVKGGLKSDILQNKLVDTMEEGYKL